MADDNTLVRKGIISCLEQLGGIELVMEAKDGLELIHKLERANELPDHFVGYQHAYDGRRQTTELIKSKWPDIGVFVLTVFDNERYMIRMIQRDAKWVHSERS